MMQLPVSGMTCQGCANTIQETVSQIPGAKNVQVNFALKQLSVDGVSRDEVVKALRSVGYDSPASSGLGEFQIPEIQKMGTEEAKEARRNFIWAALFGVPEFYIGMQILPFATHGFFWTALQALLSTVVVLVCGFGIHKRAIKQLKSGTVTMDTLVSLGSLAALLQSFMLWQRGTEHSGFEAASTIVLFILFGRYLEAKTRRATFSASSELFKTLQQPVMRLKGEKEELVSGLTLMPGDIIMLKPGEVCPIDGVVQKGMALVDESTVSGESMPRKLGIGSNILSGSTVTDSPLTVLVEKTGAQSFVGKLISELEKSQTKTVKLQRFADRVTEFFVPAVILLAGVAALVQFFLTNNPNFAFNIFLSVLLVACPCALGLAIPTALVAGLGASARHGILFKDASVLEQTSKITEIYFDKTGTLTQGAPQLTNVEILGTKTEKEILALAASLEEKSLHPLARAIRGAAFKAGVYQLVSPTDFKIIPGQGVQGKVKDHTVAIMRAEVELNANQELSSPGTCSEVFIDGQRAARLYFIDAPRPEAFEVLQNLKSQGYKLHLLTGDNRSSVDMLKKTLGLSEIFESTTSELLPSDKQNIVLDAQKKNPHGVGFVGDGINDVLALSAASVGFAIASGTPAAIGAAHVTLTGGIKDLPRALNFAERTYKQLKFNLLWAMLYNLAMIPWAMIGGLSPVWASLAMSLSSVSVVIGSLTLAFKLRH
jgi:Cu+-exporting ATPase